MKTVENEAALQAKRLEFDRLQKQLELQSMLDIAKLEKESAIQIREMENTTPTPKRRFTYLYRYFSDFMKAAQIHELQWVARLRNILLGKVLKTFQNLSDDDNVSFATVGDNRFHLRILRLRLIANVF